MSGRSADRSQRQLRVGEELRHALVDLLRRTHFRDPMLQNLNVTVTEVRVSPDLRNATVYLTTLGGVNAEATAAALDRAGSLLRGPAARAVGLRFAPALHFTVDTSFEAANRIDSLLRQLPVGRDLAAEPKRMNGDETELEVDVEDEDDSALSDDPGEYEEDDDDWDNDELDHEVEYEDEDEDSADDAASTDPEYEDDEDDKPVRGGGKQGRHA